MNKTRVFGLALSLTVVLGITTMTGSNFFHNKLSKNSVAAAAVQCATACFKSAQYYLLYPNETQGRLRNNPVLIAGENNNQPTSDPTSVYIALHGPGLYGASNATQNLNREFVAAQLSFNLNAADDGSPSAFSVLAGKLSCYGAPTLNVLPKTLSNGATLNGDSTLADLFLQTRLAIRENKVADYALLWPIWESLHHPASFSYCP